MAHESLAPGVRGAILGRVHRGLCCVQRGEFLFHREQRFSSINILVPDALPQAKIFALSLACKHRSCVSHPSPENQLIIASIPVQP